MISYEDLFIDHRGRRCSKWHHYFSIYDRFFQPYIGKNFTLLEIGVARGGSLQLWKKYFGPGVNVVGIDIDPSSFFEEEQIKVFTGDQTDRSFLNNVIDKIGEPTIIIDDGSHVQSHILKTLEVLYPRLADNGIYMIEDCHTAYWPRFEGGVNSNLNTVDILSKHTHDVNRKWFNVPKTTTFNNVDSISFYDSMVVLEKRNVLKRYMVDVDHTGPIIMDSH